MMRGEPSDLISDSVRSASADVHSQPDPMRVALFFTESAVMAGISKPSSDMRSRAKRASGKRWI